MDINFNKIKEIYGNEILNIIKENQENVIENLKYLYKTYLIEEYTFLINESDITEFF